MLKAVQLPSGSWNVKVYAGKDAATGKRQYKSFTEQTERKALMAAYDWQEHHKEVMKNTANMTLTEAIDQYLEDKTGVLSPSTMRGYRTIQKNRFKSYMNIKLSKLTQPALQRMVSAESRIVAPKTVYNAWGLVSSVLGMYRPDLHVDVQLPQAIPFEPRPIDPRDMPALFKALDGDKAEVAIWLTLFYGLRRSELRAIDKIKDVDYTKNILHIRHALVQDENGKFVEKTTKTEDSTRHYYLPVWLMDKIKCLPPTNGKYLFDFSADIPRRHLQAACDKVGITKARLHDLRHTMASIGAMLNVNEKYVMERGGWKSDKTMKKIYQHTLNTGRISADSAFDIFFANIIGGDNDAT